MIPGVDSLVNQLNPDVFLRFLKLFKVIQLKY